MTDEPSGICGRASARERQEGPGIRVQRPVPVLVLGLERGLDHARGGVVDEHVERAELRGLLGHAFGGDVAAQEKRLGAGTAQLLGGLLGGPVVPQIADRDALGPELGEAERDRLPDSPRAARHENGRAVERHRRGGSGSSAGAALGISSHPGRSRGTRGPSCALEEACPSRSSRSICVCGVAAHVVVLRQVEDELLDPRAQLVGEVRRGRRDERVDVVGGRLRHGEKPTG